MTTIGPGKEKLRDILFVCNKNDLPKLAGQLAKEMSYSAIIAQSFGEEWYDDQLKDGPENAKTLRNLTLDACMSFQDRHRPKPTGRAPQAVLGMLGWFVGVMAVVAVLFFWMKGCA